MKLQEEEENEALVNAKKVKSAALNELWLELAKIGQIWFQSAAEARKYLKILIWPVQIYGHREDDERSEMAGVERKGKKMDGVLATFDNLWLSQIR